MTVLLLKSEVAMKMKKEATCAIKGMRSSVYSGCHSYHDRGQHYQDPHVLPVRVAPEDIPTHNKQQAQ